MLYGLATGLAEALTAIHAAGIVHRDLKPSNVLLTAGGPKVIDFGIAQALDTTSLTKTGITVGSAGFMAPEQVMGKAGTAADIFTWAVTVAYAASGQSPFGTGASDAILYRIVHAAPDITAVPPGLRPLVEAALAKEPQARPTAQQLLSQLTQHRRAAIRRVRQPYPDHPRADLAPVRDGSGRAPAGSRHAPGVPLRPPGPAPPTGPGHRAAAQLLLPVVLTLAFLLAAGGTALGFALAGKSGRHARGRGRQHDADPAGAARPGHHEGATAPSTSPASEHHEPGQHARAPATPGQHGRQHPGQHGRPSFRSSWSAATPA